VSALTPQLALGVCLWLPSVATAQADDTAALFARAIEAATAHRQDLKNRALSIAFDGRRLEMLNQQAALEGAVRGLGSGRAIYRRGFLQQGDCRADCASPFAEPLLVVSSVKGAGDERLLVMSLMDPDPSAIAGDRGATARSLPRRTHGELILVTMRRDSLGWRAVAVQVGSARGPR
jgi:hypothetical protein